MVHPFTSRKVYLLSYLIVWICLALIQIFIFINFYDLSFLQAVSDSLVVNLFQSVTGLALWYPVRFNPLSSKNFIEPVLNIVVTGILTVLVWIGFSYFVLKTLFQADPVYISFLLKSIPNRIIVDSLLFVILVMIYSLIVYSQNLNEKVNAELKLKTLVRDAELNMLKTQINPHFLFNSLNSISHLVNNDSDKAREMIIELSDFLRFSLRHNEKENILLGEEMENIERYLQIEKIRFGSKLGYQSRIASLANKCTIPNMILQPIIENAIKHGVYESSNPVHIGINIEKGDGFLEIMIKNNYDPEVISKKGTGTGLKNIQSRLEILYGRKDLLRLITENGIFIVNLKIPQNEIEKC